MLTLTTAQQTAFVNALLALKANGKYDSYILTHASALAHATPATGDPTADLNNPTYRDAAQGGPAFFPWHRALLLSLEKDLSGLISKQVWPLFAMPYWNWAADSALAPGASPIWSPSLMGGDGDPTKANQVTTGPFRTTASGGIWTTVEQNPDGTSAPPASLRRTLGRGISLPAGATLPTPKTFSTTQLLSPYDAANFSSATTSGFRVAAESLDDLVHLWVGGSMELPTSPNDPVFFLHYCNLDRLWNLWQTSVAGGLGKGYLPVSGGPVGHNLPDGMFPWNTAADMQTPADLVNSLTLGYKYDSD